MKDSVSGTEDTLHIVTPSYRPAGGIVKLFDYAVHALELGYSVQAHCPVRLDEGDLLFSVPRFSGLREHSRVSFSDSLRVGIGLHDWAMFSWPPHYESVVRGLGPGIPHERIIHLIQGVRVGNPSYGEGYSIRLLSRPLARIMVTEQAAESCRPYLNRESTARTIIEGHDLPFFHRRRTGGLSAPIRVGYTTWKSDLGVRVEEKLRRRFAFRSIRKPAPWKEIRELMQWCDVFLATPGPEEGFFLPGLEAMAAGAIVLIPDVGGNRAYCRFGENCIAVAYDSVEDCVAALSALAEADDGTIAALRERGYETMGRHTLTRERSEFAQFMVELAARCERRAFERRAA